MFTEDRARHEAEQTARVAYEYALETKIKAKRLAEWIIPILQEAQELLRHPDKADRTGILAATNHLTLAGIELRTLAERPVSAQP